VEYPKALVVLASLRPSLAVACPLDLEVACPLDLEVKDNNSPTRMRDKRRHRPLSQRSRNRRTASWCAMATVASGNALELLSHILRRLPCTQFSTSMRDMIRHVSLSSPSLLAPNCNPDGGGCLKGRTETY